MSQDTMMEDLLRAQTPPKNWVVYRVQTFVAHAYTPISEIGEHRTWCAICGLSVHPRKPETRHLAILVNGPLRHMTVLTRDREQLPLVVRNWLSTLFNLATVAGTPLEDWVAYDGRGDS